MSLFAASSSVRSARLVLPIYVLTIFTSAALLFSVQPLFTKMVLPQLGGAPGVWSVAMVVFQALLLAGYAYAHALGRWLPATAAILLHLAVTLAAMLALPLAVRDWGTVPAEGQTLWMLGLFVLSIGAPFFALSANGPLLQAWFARTRHDSANDPYFLYAASNVGSFAALIAYPVAIEPLMTLGAQRGLWSAGYLLLLVLLTACALFVRRGAGPLAEGVQGADEPALAPDRVLAWIALSAVPSGLLVAVTAQISTDIASAPLLWVVPLALYLLTFVIVFQRRPVVSHSLAVRLQPAALGLVLIFWAFALVGNFLPLLAVHLLAFFLTAMVCHGELVRRKPGAARLTTFYLCMSLGGVIGGLFAGLIAPAMFSWVAEYPILLVLAVLCRPGFDPRAALRDPWLWATVAGGAALMAAPLVLGQQTWMEIGQKAIAAAVIASVLLAARPIRFAAAIAAIVLAIHLNPLDGRPIETVRSFYGVHKIGEAEGRFRLLQHGTTVHGAQRIRDEDGSPVTGRPEPLSYYYAGSPMAQTIDTARRNAGAPIAISVVGLGTGSLACHARPGETWRFYEIDAAVERIARDPRWFTFLSSCLPDVPVVLGDARLTLATEPDGTLDLLIVDAFSSDAIPVHLLTREAMAIYRARMKPAGLVVLHVSHRHMELASVVAGIANANGMTTLVNDLSATEETTDEDEYKFGSIVAASAADPAALAPLREAGWLDQEVDPGQRVWTDDYSNIVGAILRFHAGGDADGEGDGDEDAPDGGDAPAARDPAP